MYSIFNVRYKTGRTTGSPFDFFSALCDFFSIFLSPKGPPFKIFDILQQTEDSKSPKGLPFLLFRHYETVSKFSFSVFFRNYFKKFFECFLMSPKGPSSFFCNKLDFQKVERAPPFTISKTALFEP